MQKKIIKPQKKKVKEKEREKEEILNQWERKT